jgi:hypothetical protein
MKRTGGRSGVAALLALGAVVGYLVTAGAAGAGGGDSVTYTFDAKSAVAKADAPLRIVLVGFTKGQLNEASLLS